MIKIFRLFSILRLCIQYRIGALLPRSGLRTLLQILSWLNFSRKTSRYNRAVNLRLALESLGPIFVKFGQSLSTRPDLIPEDLMVELVKLQDQVPSFSSEQVAALLLEAYGKPPEAVFKSFSITPLASASVAQVHAAILPTGESVVVKIIRPGIEKQIQQDIHLLYFLADKATRWFPDLKRLRLREIVSEFEKIIFNELDLLREAANATQLRRNFANSALMYVPLVYWDYCRPKILVIERIYGIRISDREALDKAGTDLRELAKRGVEIFYAQVFRDKFFHADMHPGNIFVNVSDPKFPQYLGVDFGIMGTLNDEDHFYLAQNFLAFFNRDYAKVARLHIDSGWVPPQTRPDELECAIRTVCEPVFNKPLRDISFAVVLLRLFQVARQFHMEIQPQLVLLQKTLLNVEGLGRQLYPDLNLWETAKPYLQNMMKNQVGIRGFFRKLFLHLPQWIERLPEWPEKFSKQTQPTPPQLAETIWQENQVRLARVERRQKRNQWIVFLFVIGLGSILIWI